MNWSLLLPSAGQPPQAGKRRVVVLGDLMLDEQIHGAVHRISPEAPVPVVRVTSRTHHPGGAANVARNVSALSGQAELAGVTGIDEAGRVLREQLSAADIAISAVVASPSRCTSRKSRVLAHGYHHIVRFDEEVSDPLEPGEEAALWAALESRVEASEALVLSDYAKGVLTPGICQRSIGTALRRRIPVVVDPKGVDFAKYRGASVITPNYGEALAAARHLDGQVSEDESDTNAERIGLRLLEAYGCPLVLTRGAKGMSVVEPGKPVVHIAAKARRVFDVTGAGDTVVAVLALAMAAGLPLAEAAAMSTEAAGRVIQLPGTAVITLAELMS